MKASVLRVFGVVGGEGWRQNGRVVRDETMGNRITDSIHEAVEVRGALTRNTGVIKTLAIGRAVTERDTALNVELVNETGINSTFLDGCGPHSGAGSGSGQDESGELHCRGSVVKGKDSECDGS